MRRSAGRDGHKRLGVRWRAVGRAVLAMLAAGGESLCGYVPVPPELTDGVDPCHGGTTRETVRHDDHCGPLAGHDPAGGHGQ